jgi:hypothetical protein
MITSGNLNEVVPVVCNTGDSEIFANIRSAVSRGLPELTLSPAHEGVAVIVGGGPSMRPLVPMIRAFKDAGCKIFAVNGTMQFLASQGIETDFFVMLDAREGNLRFIEDRDNVEYLLAAQVHPDAFDLLAGEKVTLWFPNFPGVIDVVGREAWVIGGGTTVGLQAMSIAYTMGYRALHLFGFDSSYADDDGHAYAQDLNAGERIDEVTVAGKVYRAAPWMVRQAVEFEETASQLANDDCVVMVHGEGLLPAIASNMMREPITVLTVYRSGGQYTPEYVTRLRDGVAAHLTIPHRFVCMTDEPIEGVECIPLELGLPGWWSKPEIFRADLPFNRVLYLDLSCVVSGLLDDMAMQDGICITSDWYYGGPSQSVLLYNVGDFANLWEAFSQDPAKWMTEGDKMIAPNFGDQILVRELPVPEMKYWQDVLPGHLVSYKVHCQTGIPEHARLIKFHGQPKPADVNWLEPLAVQAAA